MTYIFHELADCTKRFYIETEIGALITIRYKHNIHLWVMMREPHREKRGREGETERTEG